MKNDAPPRPVPLLQLLTCVAMAFALAGCNGSETPIPSLPGAWDDQDFAGFVDRFFEEQLDELDIPGAVFVFVRDGEVLLSKGYGLADMENEIPMDPDSTVMRIGSVSKLIVATAVMQLAEQGLLDLHADVNEYLTAFQVSDDFEAPITLAHLLTHSAGLDHPPFWVTADPAEVLPLGQYLLEQLPPRILPPGDVLGYSSPGYDLAAYIVEVVSATPFSQYVEENILEPLGMERSGYLTRPPVPQGMATGYALEGATQVPQPITYDPGYPSGGFVSTAGDMARLITAFLEGGCYEGTCILGAETVVMMQEQQFTNNTLLPGWTYGFTEGFHNDQRLIGHGGATTGFGSDMTLLPAFDLGYFISFNEECYRTGACALVGLFRSQFLDAFFPAEIPEPPAYESNTDLDHLAGTYRYIRYSHSAIYEWEYSYYDVAVARSGDELVLNGMRFIEIAPLVFQQVEGQMLMAFREDGQGSVLYMFNPDTFERVD